MADERSAAEDQDGHAPLGVCSLINELYAYALHSILKGRLNLSSAQWHRGALVPMTEVSAIPRREKGRREG